MICVVERQCQHNQVRAASAAVLSVGEEQCGAAIPSCVPAAFDTCVMLRGAAEPPSASTQPWSTLQGQFSMSVL